MTELRHVKTYGAIIYPESRGWGGFIQEKLQPISTIDFHAGQSFTDRSPNLRKLGTSSISQSSFDFSCLHKLETLKFSSYPKKNLLSPSKLRLPPSLRKLSLTGFKILGEFMKYLSKLPNLEVLKLQECELVDGDQRKWDAEEQVFCRLQFLLLERLELVHWEADETNFPRLRHLFIRGCSALEAIPCGIGEISTLQTIELDECSPSIVASAELIIEEQHGIGNYNLQLRT